MNLQAKDSFFRLNLVLINEVKKNSSAKQMLELLDTKFFQKKDSITQWYPCGFCVILRINKTLCRHKTTLCRHKTWIVQGKVLCVIEVLVVSLFEMYFLLYYQLHITQLWSLCSTRAWCYPTWDNCVYNYSHIVNWTLESYNYDRNCGYLFVCK